MKHISLSEFFKKKTSPNLRSVPNRPDNMEQVVPVVSPPQRDVEKMSLEAQQELVSSLFADTKVLSK